jgi:hypothetical protein
MFQYGISMDYEPRDSYPNGGRMRPAVSFRPPSPDPRLDLHILRLPIQVLSCTSAAASGVIKTEVIGQVCLSVVRGTGMLFVITDTGRDIGYDQTDNQSKHTSSH